MDQYVWPDRTTPLQSVWSVVLSTMMVECEQFVYLLNNNNLACTLTDQHARPDKTTPLLQSAWRMTLSAMTVECERFIYLFNNLTKFRCVVLICCMHYLSKIVLTYITQALLFGRVVEIGFCHRLVVMEDYSIPSYKNSYINV